MKTGDWVRVTTRSVHCNPHINNVGEVGVVQEINDRCAHIKTSTGGMGTVDRDCLISHTPTPGQESRYLSWHGELPNEN